MRRDEVLQNVEAFAEIREDRIFDDLTGRLCHQAAHTCELPDLCIRTTSTGIGHHQDRVQLFAFLFTRVHRRKHFFCDEICDVRPDSGHLVLAFKVGHGRVFVLLAKLFNLNESLVDDALFACRGDHIVNAD